MHFYACINNEHNVLARKYYVNLFFIGDSNDTKTRERERETRHIHSDQEVS